MVLLNLSLSLENQSVSSASGEGFSGGEGAASKTETSLFGQLLHVVHGAERHRSASDMRGLLAESFGQQAHYQGIERYTFGLRSRRQLGVDRLRHAGDELAGGYTATVGYGHGKPLRL